MDTATAASKQPTFGNLQINMAAKSKRGNTKFFDSAEWVMQQQKQESIKRETIKMQSPYVFKTLQLSVSNDKSPIIC